MASDCGCYALKQRSDSVLFREAMRASVTPPNSSSRRFGPATWGEQQRQGQGQRQARLGGRDKEGEPGEQGVDEGALHGKQGGFCIGGTLLQQRATVEVRRAMSSLGEGLL